MNGNYIKFALERRFPGLTIEFQESVVKIGQMTVTYKRARELAREA